MIGLAVLGISVVGGAIHGAFHRNSPVFGPALGKIENGRKVVALTFDDGPNPDATPLILDTLREKGVRATFFILGIGNANGSANVVKIGGWVGIVTAAAAWYASFAAVTNSTFGRTVLPVIPLHD